jgi:hypothetical protein
MHVHYSPVISAFRVYEGQDGYATREPYIAIVYVQFLSDDTVYLSGAHGRINKESYDKAFDMLRARGVTKALYERHGKLKERLL